MGQPDGCQGERFADDQSKAFDLTAVQLAQGTILDMISAGRRVHFGYNLPRGTHMMSCGVPDEEDGKPHISMGMWMVGTLR